METEPRGIRYQSEHFDKVQGIMHYVNEETLLQEHRKQNRKKASGIDGVTKDEYGENLSENISNLVERMKKFQYRPQAVRRTYIPKPNGKMRPLGILAYEDKLVQAVMADVLSEVYEPRFRDESYGFRPRRGAHDAVAKVNQAIMFESINWVLEADIKSFFDTIDQDVLMELLKQDIDDKNFLRYVKRFLKAGIVENGTFEDSDRGVAQGGGLSPILGNVYLHYALDTWFCEQIKPLMRGKTEYVRFADDFIILFQEERDARRVMEVLGKRLAKFGLELAEDKTRIVPIGRKSKTKDTFDFLGFTFYNTKARSGRYRLGIKTSNKKLKTKHLQVKQWARSRINLPVHETMEIAQKAIIGHFNYYGVNGNIGALDKFEDYVKSTVKRTLCRRSQKGYMTWEKFERMWRYYEVSPRVTKNIWNWQPVY